MTQDQDSIFTKKTKKTLPCRNASQRRGICRWRISTWFGVAAQVDLCVFDPDRQRSFDVGSLSKGVHKDLRLVSEMRSKCRGWLSLDHTRTALLVSGKRIIRYDDF